MPELPENLEKLFCWNNQLTKLPKLPDNLKLLYCDNNKLDNFYNNGLNYIKKHQYRYLRKLKMMKLDGIKQ